MPEQFCPHCMRTVTPGSAFCPSCGQQVNITAAPHQLPVGTVLHSAEGHTFLFGKAKGEGGFGITYVAKETGSGMVVAIKEYFPMRCQPQRQPDLAVMPAAQMEEAYRKGMNSFLSEASMIRAVSDTPSIVHVLDFFEANNTAYMVMNYLNGVTLSQILQTQERFEPGILLNKMLPLMRDIGRLHRAGVLHRDIAPDNVMMMPDGTLTLLDFGCARSMEDGRSMTVILKPGFAPIEQYQTRGQGPYTDIYALCACLYYCITGKIPPAAPNRLGAVYDGGIDPLLPPGSLGASVTKEQEQLLLWGLNIQPTQRPQTMEELASRLEQTLPATRVQWPFRNLVQDGKQVRNVNAGTNGSFSVEDFVRKYGIGLLIGAGALILVLLILIVILLFQ